MKTQVEITSDTNECRLTKGMIGYIDGYVRAADDRAYAVVVSGRIIDLVALNVLKPLKIESNQEVNP